MHTFPQDACPIPARVIKQDFLKLFLQMLTTDKMLVIDLKNQLFSVLTNVANLTSAIVLYIALFVIFVGFIC